MTSKNHLNIPEEDLTEIDYALSVLEERLIPHLKKLRMKDDEERIEFYIQEFPKIRKSYIEYLKVAYDHAILNPMIMANHEEFNPEAFRNDILAAEQLLEIKKRVKRVLKQIDKTNVSHEASVQRDLLWRLADQAEYYKVPGASEVLDDVDIWRRAKKNQKDNNKEDTKE